MPAEKPSTVVKQELPEQIASHSELIYVKQEAPGKRTDETNNQIVATKKRGRKKKSEISSSIKPDNSNTTTPRTSRAKKVDYFALVNDHDHEVESAPKRRKRRNNNEQIIQKNQNSNNPQNDTQATDPLAPELPVSPKRKGRKSKAQKAADRLQQRLQEISEYNENEPVVCGRCNLSMEGAKWKHHKQLFHNDLAWKSGEAPIDLNNRALVVSILTKVYKAQRPLNCENCGMKKKSVMGFLSHKMQCEKSEEEIVQMKVKCELCGNTMLPVSLTAHMRLSHGPNKSRDSDFSEDVLVPRSKRKAAEKAEDLIHSVAEDKEDAAERATYHFISRGIDFLAKLRAKQKYGKELEKNGHIKCKFVGCDFLANSVVQITEHMYNNCSQKPDSIFACRLCLLVFNNSQDAMQHILNQHSQAENEYSVEDLSSDADEDDIPVFDSKKKPTKEPRFLLKTKVAKSANVLYPLSYHWSSQFCKNFFNTQNLFQNCLVEPCNWQQIDLESLPKYSPELSHSMDVAIKRIADFVDVHSESYLWKNFELFESAVSDGVSTIFCGGPITSLAWVPTPHDENVEQILAVSIVTDFNKKYYIHERNAESAMIQFWNFGVLDNENLLEKGAQMEFCLCHDFGYITHMEWCPSGCYDVTPNYEGERKLQRLGLLAVAGSDSFVYIFSIPKPSQLKAKLLKAAPLLKLRVQTEDEQELAQCAYIPTKLSWTKAQEHRYVAVGYSNGLAALFDLNTAFPLLKSRENDGYTELLLPIKVFQPHLHEITAIHLYHTSKGCRWLATASLDRHCKFWDLKNTSSPINTLKKLAVTDGVWLTHWSSAIFGFDDSGSGNANTPTLVYPAREFRSEPRSIIYSGATITTVAASDWLNGVIQGNSSGELIGSFPHQLMVGLENDRTLKYKKVLLSYARLVEKNLTPAERVEVERKKCEAIRNKLKKIVKKREEENDNYDADDANPHYCCYEPLDYEGATRKYGIVFCDTDVVWADKRTIDKLEYQSESLLLEQSNTYLSFKVNKTSFNPNKQSYVYFASGYQAGFVRIASLKNLKTKR